MSVLHSLGVNFRSSIQALAHKRASQSPVARQRNARITISRVCVGNLSAQLPLLPNENRDLRERAHSHFGAGWNFISNAYFALRVSRLAHWASPERMQPAGRCEFNYQRARQARHPLVGPAATPVAPQKWTLPSHRVNLCYARRALSYLWRGVAPLSLSLSSYSLAHCSNSPMRALGNKKVRMREGARLCRSNSSLHFDGETRSSWWMGERVLCAA